MFFKRFTGTGGSSYAIVFLLSREIKWSLFIK